MRTLVVGAGDGCYKLAAALGPILRITLAVVFFPRGAQKVFGLYDYKSFSLPFGSEGNYPRSALAYSHSIVAGGLLVTSRKTASILPFPKLIISSAIS